MPDYHIPLFPNQQYHILSRAIGDEKMFRQDKNYHFFLSRYQRHISPVANTYCYCLLPNHFHFLIRIKDEERIKAYFEKIKKGKLYIQEHCSDFIMERFSNLLNSYTKSFNKIYNRKGGLFIDYMRRVPIESNRQFQSTAFYIHKNPVHHGYCDKIHHWPWSSYNTLLSEAPTGLLRNELMGYFGGRDGFIDYHSRPIFR